MWWCGKMQSTYVCMAMTYIPSFRGEWGNLFFEVTFKTRQKYQLFSLKFLKISNPTCVWQILTNTEWTLFTVAKASDWEVSSFPSPFPSSFFWPCSLQCGDKDVLLNLFPFAFWRSASLVVLPPRTLMRECLLSSLGRVSVAFGVGEGDPWTGLHH